MNGYTRREFAAEFDLPYSTLTNYENGTRKPPFELLLNMARTLGTTVEYLMGYSDNPKPATEEIGQYGKISLEHSFWNLAENIGYRHYRFGTTGRHYIEKLNGEGAVPINDDEYKRLMDSIVDYAKYSLADLQNKALSREAEREENELQNLEEFAKSLNGNSDKKE